VRTHWINGLWLAVCCAGSIIRCLGEGEHLSDHRNQDDVEINGRVCDRRDFSIILFLKDVWNRGRERSWDSNDAWGPGQDSYTQARPPTLCPSALTVHPATCRCWEIPVHTFNIRDFSSWWTVLILVAAQLSAGVLRLWAQSSRVGMASSMAATIAANSMHLPRKLQKFYWKRIWSVMRRWNIAYGAVSLALWRHSKLFQALGTSWSRWHTYTHSSGEIVSIDRNLPINCLACWWPSF